MALRLVVRREHKAQQNGSYKGVYSRKNAQAAKHTAKIRENQRPDRGWIQREVIQPQQRVQDGGTQGAQQRAGSKGKAALPFWQVQLLFGFTGIRPAKHDFGVEIAIHLGKDLQKRPAASSSKAAERALKCKRQQGVLLDDVYQHRGKALRVADLVLHVVAAFKNGVISLRVSLLHGSAVF